MKKYIVFMISMVLFFGCRDVYALTGTVNVNDSLSLRSGPSTTNSLITKFYNNTVLNIVSTNAGSGNGCSNNWYQVTYGNYSGYVCGTYVNLNSSSEDDSYQNNDNSISLDGSVLCYEDTSDLSLRSSANGSKTNYKLSCGEEVSILGSVDTPGAVCPYWYQVNSGSKTGYVCGYYINTTKLSSTALNYYNSSVNEESVDSYKAKLTKAGFPDSYHSYLLELHARHPNWNFVAEQINLSYDEVIAGEAVFGRNLLQGSNFDEGYLSLASSTYNPWTNTFYEYSGEKGWYQASNEAIAYYLDPRNYLNDRYIFAFETLEFKDNQTSSIILNFFQGKSLFNIPYQYYQRISKGSNGYYADGSNGIYADDIVRASSLANVSALHVSSRILQEVGSSGSASSTGVSFNYCGSTYSGYYNFFNIGATATSCSTAIQSGLKYAKDKGWDTPYKSLVAGAAILSNNYIRVNQDTIYYEKFDVSTTNGNFTHQYQQNLTAPVSEGGTTYQGYVNQLSSYLASAITFVIPVYKNMPSSAVRAPLKGNPNNYLKSISIDDKEIDNFSYNTYNYNIHLSSGIDSINISASPIISTATIHGTGNIKITSDNQDINIVVTSLNGKTRTYFLHITKDTSDTVPNVNPTNVADLMNHSGFKYNDSYLFGISVGTNVSTLIGNIKNYNSLSKIEVKSASGNVKVNDSFRTGDVVSITGSNGSKNYTVIIYGDIDGDGEISRKDLLLLQREVFGYGSINGIYREASDIDKNGKLDRTDLLKLQRDVFGYGSIAQ